MTSTLTRTPRPTLNPVLRPFWTIPARNRVLYGGRASSKSWDAAGFAIYLAANFKVKFLCVRQFQNKIDESVYSLLKSTIERFGLEREFDVQKSKIIHRQTKSEFIFYGLWRHITEIKSTEGVDICWIEEAHGLTKEQWDILEPTVRKEGSQFWIIFNPKLVSDFVYRKFVVGSSSQALGHGITGEIGGTIKRKINYTENPFISNTLLKVIDALKREDEDEFRHIYGGDALEDDDSAIIKRSWAYASINAHEKLKIEVSGRKRLGFDVADDGNDLNSAVAVHGIVTTHVEEWKGREDELLKSATRVYNLARQLDSEIVYDSIGIGAFAGSHFQSLNQQNQTSIQYHKFNAAGEVLDKATRIDPRDPRSPLAGDFYLNAKAQNWWEVGRRFRNTFNAVNGRVTDYRPDELISISADCDHVDRLIDELCTPRRDFDKRGKAKVESKKDLEKRDIPSPNKADGLVMAYSRAQTFIVSTDLVSSW